MGYGPEVIIDEEDRISGPYAGNWIITPGTIWWATLAKEYSNPINIEHIYTVTMEVLFPSGSDGSALSFGIRGDPSLAPSFEINASLYDEWQEVASDFAFAAGWSNDIRECYFRITGLPEDLTIEIKNISVREWKPTKIDYLPLVGVG